MMGCLSLIVLLLHQIHGVEDDTTDKSISLSMMVRHSCAEVSIRSLFSLSLYRGPSGNPASFPLESLSSSWQLSIVAALDVGRFLSHLVDRLPRLPRPRPR
ncbi:hypothetical protein FPOAC2_07806 [Fusarium poae]